MDQKISSTMWPHSNILQVFENIFMVTGTNIINHNGVRLQSSRNMVIVCQNDKLTLINTVRLNEDGLRSLEKLGQIEHIIRIGAFHGRDDAFYQRRYDAKLWAFLSMEFKHGERLDFDLKEGTIPLANSELFIFSSTNFPGALIVLREYGGILISCDSIKNWTKEDHYFDKETFALMKSGGSIGEAQIDTTWLNAMKPLRDEIKKISELEFVSLLSAHGEPLKYRAKEAVQRSVQRAVSDLS